MRRVVVFILSIILIVSMFPNCFAKTETTSLHDYIFNMWLNETLIWKETFFSEHNTFSREQIDPYPEDACWIILVPEEGMVRLCGKKSNGDWVATIWKDFTFDEMLGLCMGMCVTWETYENLGTFGIMFWYSDKNENMNRYITNNEQAKAFVEFYKEVYNIED